jgi:WD40 repeat protein
VECTFAADEVSLNVIENTYFTTLAAWNANVRRNPWPRKISAIEDGLWLYSDSNTLIVIKGLVPKNATWVLWSSFSPDGSRLATSTSDGCINIWNIHTRQVEQRFKSNQGELPFACWWSKEVLFVLFGFCEKISSLLKYPMDVNLKNLFSQSEQVPLGHLVGEFVSFSAVVGFS